MTQNVTSRSCSPRGSDGDKAALDALIPVVYESCRRQASRYLRHERPAYAGKQLR